MAKRDSYAAAFRRKAASIGDQIQQHALDLVRVNLRGKLPRRLHPEVDAVVPRQRLELSRNKPQELREIRFHVLNAHPACLELCDIEQVIHAACEHAREDLAPDNCGRLLVANKAVAVPFVGVLASTFVLAEVLRACNGGSVFYDTKVRVCSLTDKPLGARLSTQEAQPVRGLKLVSMRTLA